MWRARRPPLISISPSWPLRAIKTVIPPSRCGFYLNVSANSRQLALRVTLSLICWTFNNRCSSPVGSINPWPDLFSETQPKTWLPPLFHVNAVFCPDFWIISVCVPVIYLPLLTVPLFLSRSATPSTAVCVCLRRPNVLHLRVSNHRRRLNCRTASVCASLSLSESIQVFFSQPVWVFFFVSFNMSSCFVPTFRGFLIAPV